jgi:hypothetical protein
MKGFVSPIYIQTNSVSLEKIVLGLIAIGNNKVLFGISKNKLQIAERLLNQRVKSVLHASIQMIENKAKSSSIDPGGIFNAEYFAYLTRYSNGLVQFGALKPIAKEINEPVFAELFKLFVGEHIEKEATSKKTFQSRVKEKLSVPGVAEKADINYTLKPTIIHGLLKSTTVSLLTTNGNIQAYQAVDFTASGTSIANNLYEFEVLTKSLNKLSLIHLKKPGEFKVIAIEPPTGTSQHALFNQITQFKNDVFQIIDEVQLNEVTTEIIHKPHLKFSTFIQEYPIGI